jgi:hypothetical protein
MNEKIPEFFLEQYRLGEASPEMVRRIEADEDARTRLAELEDDSVEILQKYPPGWFAEQVRLASEREQARDERATRRKERRSTGIVSVLREAMRNPLIVPVMAAMVIGALVLPGILTDTLIPTNDDTRSAARGERLKGLESTVSVYRRGSGTAVEELSSGDVVHAGDTLQIAYNAAGAISGMIFSVDGAGTVTLHFPERPGTTTTLVQEGETALPYAYVLDDAPAFEAFYFVAFEEEVSVGPVIREVENTVSEALEEARRRDVSAVDAADAADQAIRKTLLNLMPEGVIDSLVVMKGGRSR